MVSRRFKSAIPSVSAPPAMCVRMGVVALSPRVPTGTLLFRVVWEQGREPAQLDISVPTAGAVRLMFNRQLLALMEEAPFKPAAWDKPVQLLTFAHR